MPSFGIKLVHRFSRPQAKPWIVARIAHLPSSSLVFVLPSISNSGVMNSGVNARLPLSGMSALGRKVMLNHFCLVPYWMLVSVMYLVYVDNRRGTV
ncbi:hypothetical protein CDAR_308241 [Caerostris darwini]|uniref:Uncharacterized protein n=1 Tax=Caerostris darwini TaxID=1538125 RepID=A0AAV4S989_9ARAC|nr:hypothetical protein CDAR_308241 [Caerostris darwini]